MPGAPEQAGVGSMLGLAAGIAKADARIVALERDRERIDGEIAGLRKFNHDLREMGLIANWHKVHDGQDALERIIEKLRAASEACDGFQKMMREEPGGPLAQLRELADRRRAVKRLVIWGGSISFVVTTSLNVGYLIWKWAGEW